ncbi:MAG: DNA gyrase inhibitor YacG [Deltaproteobacteria bacterium]|nr:DNA gyrase inhibitor YacG [Deltaproteobacteria bacterium]MBW2531581.1 DNA gyrase inhibitor YacG [Deltaproteobacteria bacterium]
MASGGPRGGGAPKRGADAGPSPPQGESAGKGTCPTCGGPRETTAHGPFCSDRCRLLDLHRWLEGDYRISTDPGDPSWQPSQDSRRGNDGDDEG